LGDLTRGSGGDPIPAEVAQRPLPRREKGGGDSHRDVKGRGPPAPRGDCRGVGREHGSGPFHRNPPAFVVVDGVVGMESDGPIMGTPQHEGVLVIGRNMTSVAATCARIMRIDPQKVSYLGTSLGRLGLLHESSILQ
jgi:hypothetical protein